METPKKKFYYNSVIMVYLLNFEERRKPTESVHTETGERQITSTIRDDGEERRIL